MGNSLTILDSSNVKALASRRLGHFNSFSLPDLYPQLQIFGILGKAHVPFPSQEKRWFERQFKRAVSWSFSRSSKYITHLYHTTGSSDVKATDKQHIPENLPYI